MGMVRRQAAAKTIQARWRQQLGFREAVEQSMDFGGDWDERVAPALVDPSGAAQSQAAPEPEPEPAAADAVLATTVVTHAIRSR